MARLYLVQSEPIVHSELRQFHKEKYNKSNHQIKCCIIFQSWEVKTQMWFRPTSKCSEFILKYTENHFYLKVWTNKIFTPSIVPWSSHEGLFCACLIAFYQQKKKKKASKCDTLKEKVPSRKYLVVVCSSLWLQKALKWQWSDWCFSALWKQQFISVGTQNS